MLVLTTPAPQPPPYPIYRFTVDDYHRMIQAGVLDENNNVELLEGCIVPKMGHNPPHDAAITLTDEAIRRQLPPGWLLRIQCAVTLADSEPEPDIAVVRGSARDYVTRHPGPNDIGMLVESAEASLHYDRIDKGRALARANIPIYWIINLIDRRIEVYSDPSGPGPAPAYRDRQDYGINDSVPFVLAGQVVAQIPVRDLLP